MKLRNISQTAAIQMMKFGEGKLFQTTLYDGSHYFTIRILKCRHNDHDGVSNRKLHNRLLDRLFKEQIKANKQTSKLRVTLGERWIPHTKGQ